MDGTRRRRRPIGERLVAHLRDLLRDADPGQRLPSVGDLEGELATTQVTLVNAYRRLVAVGEVVASRREGYFKPDPSRVRWRRTGPTDWAADAAEAGHSHLERDDDTQPPVTTAAARVGPHRLADLFAVPEGTVLAVRRRTRYIGPTGGTPDRPESVTAIYQLHGAAAAEVVHEEETVIPRLATESECTVLGLQPPTPVAEVVRVGHAADGAAVQVEHSITGSRLYYRLPVEHPAATGSPPA